jgi:predicted nucleic acid-binding protein
VADRFVNLVDTDILIAHLRGVAAAHAWLRHARQVGPLTASALSVTELTGGMRSEERHQVWRLIASLRVEPVTELVARRAGELMRQYRRSHTGIGLADYVIAATADVHGFTLATLNTRHFPMFTDLQPPFRLSA